MRLRIKEAAKERGVTLISLAKKLKMYRSNFSAVAAGTRGISLKKIQKIADLLGCGVDELLGSKVYPPIFHDKALQSTLYLIEKNNPDGVDKTWVNNLTLARLSHFSRIKAK
jgi:transcriptional regulator with XRE-family HTH domain